MTREESEHQALFEAAGWMARLTESRPSEQTRAAFRDWLAADRLHPCAMARVEEQWRLSAAMAPADPPRRRPALRRGRPIAGMALAAVLAAVALFVVRPLYGEARFSTGVGEVRDITLADGTLVHLDADSALDVDYQPFSRAVRLSRGAAEFSVAHNSVRPFTVAAGPVLLRDTGTQFLVRAEGGAVSAYLISGAIELLDSAGERKAALRPGTLASVSATGAVLVQATDGLKEKAWLSGKLMFDQTPLGEALDRFRHYGPVAVTVSSDDLSGLKISGLYSSTDLAGFLQSVATAYPLRLTTGSDGGVLVEKLPGKK